MNTFISILRGINVSGHRVIKMSELKELCLGLKFENVHTYIQSGNIIYQSKITNTEKISQSIKAAIEKAFGYDVPVITLSKIELENVINSNPFLNDNSNDAKFFHVTFLSNKPTKQNLEQLKTVDLKNDKYEIINHSVYLYCPESYSNSNLTNNLFEKKLKLIATTRNWKTTMELLNIANKILK